MPHKRPDRIVNVPNPEDTLAGRLNIELCDLIVERLRREAPDAGLVVVLGIGLIDDSGPTLAVDVGTGSRADADNTPGVGQITGGLPRIAAAVIDELRKDLDAALADGRPGFN